MKVVVFGASGFVGGAIARRLMARGAEVHATARNETARRKLEEQGFRVFDAHLGDPKALAEAARGCDFAVHAAGIRDRRAPRGVLGWTHVAGTENVVAASKHAGVQGLVYISSADITLSAKPRVHWDEDRVMQKPFDAHSETMGRGEETVIGAGTGAFRTLALRPAFVWGPGGTGPGDLGTATDLCAEGLERGLPLFGTGTRFVASTYIEHLAHATELALGADAASGSVLNVVDEQLTLGRDFYGDLSEALSLPPPRRGPGLLLSRTGAGVRRMIGLSAPSDARIVRRGQSHTFASERARAQLGLEAERTAAEGMEALREWAKDRGGPKALAEAAKPTPTER